MNSLNCFKAYDIRGKFPSEFNLELAHYIAISYHDLFSPKNIVIGYDARKESHSIAIKLTETFHLLGADIVNIGLCGTEEVYFACINDKTIDAGIMVTASHNPLGYNGLKIVKQKAIAVSYDSGLKLIQDMITSGRAKEIEQEKLYNAKINRASSTEKFDKSAYIDHLISYAGSAIKPLKIVCNHGGSPSSNILKNLDGKLPFEFINFNADANGEFPSGVPNPMLAENRVETADYVKYCKADIGLAWDGDFDRCFFFDENGDYINGYYMVSLLADIMLEGGAEKSFVHDGRLKFNYAEIAAKHNAKAIISKAGHSFVKEKMRNTNSIYGGEISAHHYFKEFGYCDSGMIPWLIIAGFMSRNNVKLSDLIAKYKTKYICSDEINFKIEDNEAMFNKIETHYKGQYIAKDSFDGLSLEFQTWRLNVRASNTEALIRVNIEVKNDATQLQSKIEELTKLIND